MRFGFVDSMECPDVVNTMLRATAIFTRSEYPPKFGRADVHQTWPHTAQSVRYQQVAIVWGESGPDLVNALLTTGGGIIVAAFFGEATPVYLEDAVDYAKQKGLKVVLVAASADMACEVEVMNNEPTVRRIRVETP
jgi:hypothetical protein